MTEFARAFVVLDHKRVKVQLITGSLAKAQECVRGLVEKHHDPLAGSLAVGMVEVSANQPTPAVVGNGPDVDIRL